MHCLFGNKGEQISLPPCPVILLDLVFLCGLERFLNWRQLNCGICMEQLNSGDRVLLGF